MMAVKRRWTGSRQISCAPWARCKKRHRCATHDGWIGHGRMLIASGLTRDYDLRGIFSWSLRKKHRLLDRVQFLDRVFASARTRTAMPLLWQGALQTSVNPIGLRRQPTTIQG